MSRYDEYDKDRICHMCKKNPQAPGHKCCFDCLEKSRERAERQRRQATAVSKEGYLSLERQRINAIYKNKRDKGLCAKCGRKATHGVYCYEHYIRARRAKYNQKIRENFKHEFDQKNKGDNR